MICGDVDLLVYPYLDGEFVADERAHLEQHVAGCARCRALVAHEGTFKAHLRARLRHRAPRDAAPDRSGDGADGGTAGLPEGLRGRVLAALDRADQAGDGPTAPLWRRLAPATGIFATAAAIAVFFGAHLFADHDSPLIEEAIAGHRKNLPVEVGGTDDEIRSWMQGKVSVPVRPPNLRTILIASRPTAPRLIGARFSHLASRDAGQIVYRIGSSQATLYVFDAAGWEVPAPARRVVSGRDVYLAERGGYTVALYRDRGVGYALASDLDEESLLRLVESSLGE